MAHTESNILLHFIFSTKDRTPIITGQLQADLFSYLGGIVREMGAAAIIVGGTADHVHMFIRIRPAQSPAEIVRVVKANSSRWIREKTGHRFAWQTGYGVFSVSESNVAEVSRYIANQEQHHKERTFQEEYVAFLKRNNVAYDKRYIWS
jgi:putative transposase